MEKRTIGGLIAALRKANGMTQKELAERLHVSDKSVSRWERDESAPENKQGKPLLPFNLAAGVLRQGFRYLANQLPISVSRPMRFSGFPMRERP